MFIYLVHRSYLAEKQDTYHEDKGCVNKVIIMREHLICLVETHLFVLSVQVIILKQVKYLVCTFQCHYKQLSLGDVCNINP